MKKWCCPEDSRRETAVNIVCSLGGLIASAANMFWQERKMWRQDFIPPKAGSGRYIPYDSRPLWQKIFGRIP
jgi:hypothetical protein